MRNDRSPAGAELALHAPAEEVVDEGSNAVPKDAYGPTLRDYDSEVQRCSSQ